MIRLMLLLLLLGLCQGRGLAQTKSDRLNIKLSRGAFSDTFLLLFKSGGNDKIDDQDAPKISDGYLSVAGLTAGGEKVAIEEKAYPTEPQVINLFTRGYAAGAYTLNVEWADWAGAGISATLYDQILDIKTPLHDQLHSYSFQIDTTQLSQTSRFSLLLETRIPIVEPVVVMEQRLVAYPNPCTNQLYLQVKDFAAVGELQLSDLLGRRLWRKTFKQVQPLDQLEIPVQQLTPGLYLLDWRDPANPKAATTFKIIKQ